MTFNVVDAVAADEFEVSVDEDGNFDYKLTIYSPDVAFVREGEEETEESESTSVYCGEIDGFEVEINQLDEEEYLVSAWHGLAGTWTRIVKGSELDAHQVARNMVTNMQWRDELWGSNELEDEILSKNIFAAQAEIEEARQLAETWSAA